MTKVTLFEGDGIGPEITESVVEIFNSLNIPVEFEKFDVGITLYDKTGEVLSDEAVESFKRNKLALKGPITTPVGKGFRSINVLLRKKFDLYANIRPIKSYDEIASRYKDVDIVIFRENTEGLYIGEEEMVSKDEAIALKRITRKGSERIVRMAFEYARKNDRKKVTCIHKANIMKLTDGLFLNVFNEIKNEYPEIETEDLIVDNASMQLVMRPESFDVVVTANLYGDILSDLCSGFVGGLGLIGSVNMNDDYAMYEAVHGSAPDIAGKGIANPTAFILASCMLLDDIGYKDEANRIRRAINEVFENQDDRTRDLGGKASTKEFTENIIKRL